MRDGMSWKVLEMGAAENMLQNFYHSMVLLLHYAIVFTYFTLQREPSFSRLMLI